MNDSIENKWNLKDWNNKTQDLRTVIKSGEI